MLASQQRIFGGNAVPAAMNGKPSSKHGSKAVCVLFVLREPFCKVIMTLGQLILTCSQNGTMKELQVDTEQCIEKLDEGRLLEMRSRTLLPRQNHR